jgi:hypothetical protein
MIAEKKSWLDLYRAAILDSRTERAERARCAVERRHAELKTTAVVCIEEWRKLESAQHILDILFEF